MYYQNKFRNLALQGSEEWIEARAFSFGGSEMSTVVGKNKYDDWKSLLHRKSNNVNFRQDTTEWGHLFEPIAKMYISKQCEERKQDGTIYEFGSIPHSYYPVCYSPDGLMIDGKDLVMIEIKNPIYRGVKKIPESYLEQVKTGMCIINVKHCVFYQFRFRRCKLTTKPWTVTYDRVYHKEYYKRCPDMGNISYGYLHWDIDCDLVDLGKVTSILDEIKDIPDTIKPKVIIEKPFEGTKGKVLMWKLFEYTQEIITPDKNYLSDKEDMLWAKYEELRNNCQQKILKISTVKVDISDLIISEIAPPA